MNLQELTNNMRGARNNLMNLGADDDRTVEIVVESFGAMEGALKWADELAKEFADTEGVN